MSTLDGQPTALLLVGDDWVVVDPGGDCELGGHGLFMPTCCSS